MINDDLYSLILKNFPHEATSEQEKVIRGWSHFLLSRDANQVFLLTGYAGTGKTTLIGALVRTMEQLRQRYVLLAPTGRAAKVMTEYSGHPAWTIHKQIYRRKGYSEDEHFNVAPNLKSGTLYIVDEASMISNDGFSGSLFGDGRLLDDLISFVYSAPGCRLILIGDDAQLPPVMETHSPALSESNLSGYGKDVAHYSLVEVMRQNHDSGILWNATLLRQHLATFDTGGFPKLEINGFTDVVRVMGGDIIETLESSYSQVGEDETIIVTRSNKRASQYNQGIRSRILYHEEELCSGDRIMVVRNNYLFSLSPKEEDKDSGFIANGDICVVKRFRNEHTLYGLRYADAILRFPDYDDVDVEATVMLDVLRSDSPALSSNEQKRLWNEVYEDYGHIRNKKQRLETMKQDRHLNALQIKYSYAVTCHKAQGGQWSHVYVDQGYITPEMMDADYYRWLYTAITRAKDKVFLINWPKL